MQNENKIKILNKTTSICPKCFKVIGSEYMEKEGGIYYSRLCPDHGYSEVLISRNPDTYSELFSYYSSFGLQDRKAVQSLPDQLSVFPTTKCSLKCPVCFADRGGLDKDVRVEDVRKTLRNFKHKKVNILGGEATDYPELDSLIRMITDTGNIPILFTNGLKICDQDYLKGLNNLGVKEVHLQFDGTEDRIYERLRNKKLFHSKEQAIKNLARLDIKVVLEALIDGEVNGCQIGNIINFALQYDNIKGINFRTYFVLGKKEDRNGQLLLDELLQLASEQTEGRLNIREVLEFQKILYACASIFGIKICLKHRFFIVYRQGKDHFISVNKMFRLGYLKNAIERFKELKQKKSRIAHLYLVSQLFANSIFTIKPDNIKVVWNYMLVLFKKKFCGVSISKVSFRDKSLMINFERPCDNDTFDLNEPCDNMVIDCDGNRYGTFYLASIAREKSRKGMPVEKAPLDNKQYKLSFLVPYYNEESIIKKNIEHVLEQLKSRFGPSSYELILVNDNSSDKSLEIASQFKAIPCVSLINFSEGPSHRENLGKAMRQARGDIICFFDIDLSCSMDALKDLVGSIQNDGFDLAIGNRYDSSSTLKRKGGRKALSKIYNGAVKILWGSKIDDHQCGFKAMRRDVLSELLDEMGPDPVFSRRWFWDTELLLRAQKRNCKIKEIPVHWEERAKEKKWFIFLWREARMLFYILKNYKNLV